MDINEKSLLISQQLQSTFSKTVDFVHQELYNPSKNGYLMYMTNLCDPEIIKTQIIAPFYQIEQLNEYTDFLSSFSACTQFHTVDDAIQAIWDGKVVIFLGHELLVYHAKKFEGTQIFESSIEPTILGPNDSLTGSLETNIRMIRQRYLKDTFQSEYKQLAGHNKLSVTLAFDLEAVDTAILNELRKKLQQMDIQRIDQMQQLLTTQKGAIFPTVLMTGRPDRIVKNMQEGRIVVLVEGSSLAYILPTIFLDFFHSMDEFYHLRIIGNFLLAIRLIALALALFLPGAFIVVTSFIPEFFRVELALSIAGSRLMIPYPAFVEMFFLLFMIELLTEASIRLPKAVGSAGTTVGGLILGQAAIEAGIVSNTVVIIVAAVALSNFVIPIQNMSYGVRIMKYVFLMLSLLFGLLGLLIGFIGLVFYITNLPNYGVPFLQLFTHTKGTGERSGLQ
ncbi:spore germination protein [Paenibacillus agricola]|uniref:Spore germination protein n=1 Tax=Paenibacillus agricola TaxID=2716264 RepID=A0ABX0JCL8_9BACL|nr:spore germination protein [Paenibacillus agricola]NHN32986.1 spore germination protein [Paenibacillus agricola]